MKLHGINNRGGTYGVLFPFFDISLHSIGFVQACGWLSELGEDGLWNDERRLPNSTMLNYFSCEDAMSRSKLPWCRVRSVPGAKQKEDL